MQSMTWREEKENANEIRGTILYWCWLTFLLVHWHEKYLTGLNSITKRKNVLARFRFLWEKVEESLLFVIWSMWVSQLTLQCSKYILLLLYLQSFFDLDNIAHFFDVHFISKLSSLACVCLQFGPFKGSPLRFKNLGIIINPAFLFVILFLWYSSWTIFLTLILHFFLLCYAFDILGTLWS